MTKQFENESSRYGSRMGRWESPNPEPVARSVRCFQVRLDSGGYDDGGAYWGLGKPLYCLDQSEHETVNAYGNRVYFRAFIRASSRKEAIAASGLADFLFIRGEK